MKAILTLIVLLSAPNSVLAATIPTVPVGNVGNANDPATGNTRGGVNYAYRIGTYEVTVGQYTEFLNAVAATDTYSLYSLSMRATDPAISGIDRTGSVGSYQYSVSGSANNPITFVTWWNAVRFANWLHNGQPTGAQDASTTEDGAYPLNGLDPGTPSVPATIVRKPGAKWFLPSENEWYKAAYHQPAEQGGDADNYWTYPTRTNNEPNSDEPPGDSSIQTNVANFFRDDGLANGYNDGYAVPGSAFLTDVGAYAFAASFYGTFDQGGNVLEWTETVNSMMHLGAVYRGGSWQLSSISMRAGNRGIQGPRTTGRNTGFRAAAIATIPEPSTFILTLAAIAVLSIRCRNGD